MLRIFINVFLSCKYIFNIFKNEFLVLCIVSTIFTNVTNVCNRFLIFYDYLNFCYFITSTFYFQLIMYLRDITVSTKELFWIRLTLISNSSDCEGMIALFYLVLFFYSFCCNTKEIWGWKLVYQQSSYFLACPIFPQTNPWAHILRIL